MYFKLFFGLLLVGALASAGWYFRDDPALRRALNLPQQASLPTPAKGAASTSAAPTAPPPGLRKCVRGNQVEYTSEPCPPGTKEQAINRGAVTTMPAQGQAQGQAQQAAPAGKDERPLNQAMEKLAR